MAEWSIAAVLKTVR